jgi:hypothetical protein
MKIASASAYLELINGTNFDEFTSKGFKCDVNNTYSAVDCYRKGNCSEVVDKMSSFIFNTRNSGGFMVQLEISPYAYLIDSPTSDVCLSLVKTSNSAENFVLGAPFFRSYGISLNYSSASISIYDGNK